MQSSLYQRENNSQLAESGKRIHFQNKLGIPGRHSNDNGDKGHKRKVHWSEVVLALNPRLAEDPYRFFSVFFPCAILKVLRPTEMHSKAELKIWYSCAFCLLQKRVSFHDENETQFGIQSGSVGLNCWKGVGFFFAFSRNVEICQKSGGCLTLRPFGKLSFF